MRFIFVGAGGLQADPTEASQMFQELSKEGHPQAQVSHGNHCCIFIPKNNQNFWSTPLQKVLCFLCGHMSFILQGSNHFIYFKLSFCQSKA